MQKIVLGLVVVFAIAQGVALGQSGAPKAAVDITNAQVQEVLKYAPPKTDQTLRVIDMGSYQMSVAVDSPGQDRRASGWWRIAGACCCNSGAAL